ncbi:MULTISPECIES: HAD family phosphatase [Peptoniphilus]|uniref:HAD family hydrolase n=1 Tax=Peptoniphilus TaxID=162289 RepID=UPI0001DA9FC6|nr:MULTISPECIES: HAD family phosphatase [Peptoniphilus]EFI41578.1 HAD hydrolase, family IA, variant 3 [Peptoniphilus sp. oral taxon 386 str. F0131]
MKAVIFDLDGTLIDSMPMWRDLGRDYLESLNIELEDKVAQKIATLSLKMNSVFLKEYYNLKDSAEKIYDDFKDLVMHFYLNEVKPKDDAFRVLEDFKKSGYDIVLGTATSTEFIEPLFNRFNIREYFNFVQTCDMVGIAKNDSEYFKLISKRLNHSPDEIFLFDDAPFALKAAKKAGLVTVGVYEQTCSEHWDEIKAKNDYHINSFREWEVR